MSLLNIPDLLRGKWEHAVFLTYGVDIPLFENGFSRQLPPSCRNKVLIADGRRFLAACNALAAAGQVRHLNRTYVADGVLTPNAMHVKAILLANSTDGRLLVGSGNLSMQGYASGGELFSCYEFGENKHDELSAFLVFRSLLDALIKNQEVGRGVITRIDHLFQQVPWLHLPFPSGPRLVYDNLTRSLFDQFYDAIGGESVTKLTILSPFFDPQASALASMLNTLRPEETVILVQPARVQVDPSALHRVISGWGGKVEVCPIRLPESDSYIHAKLYLAQTHSRVICLQGSPNLSQVALLRTFANGNLETANIYDLTPDASEAMLSHISIGAPILDISTLQVQAINEDNLIPDAGFYIVRVELDGNTLSIEYRRDLPPLNQVRFKMQGNAVDWTLRESIGRRLVVELSANAQIDRGRPLPVAIEWGQTDARHSSNTVYAYILDSLDRALDFDDRESHLSRFGDLDLGDLVLVQILAELESTLVLDRASLWSGAARRVEEIRADGQGEALRLDEIDEEAIRSHPKIQQYLRSDRSSTWRHRGRLQLILSVITGHFDTLRGLPASVQNDLLSGKGSTSFETEEEAEEAEQQVEASKRETSATSWSDKQRVQRVLLSFFERYFRGIQDTDFQRRVGTEVIVTNYRIVSFLIWRLIQTGHLTLSRAVEQFSLANEWFWRQPSDSGIGYWWSLSDEERATADVEFQSEHLYPTIIASLYKAAFGSTTFGEAQDDTLTRLRDVARTLLSLEVLPLTDELTESAWVLVNDGILNASIWASDVVRVVGELVDRDSRDEFLRWVEGTLGLQERSCKVERVGVRRLSTGRDERVSQLTLGSGQDGLDESLARLLLQEWMRRERQDYYRITNFDRSAMAYYDALLRPPESPGLYFDKRTGDEVDLWNLKPASRPWDEFLVRWSQIASNVDDKMTSPSWPMSQRSKISSSSGL